MHFLNRKVRHLSHLPVFLILAFGLPSAWACTGIILHATDGSTVPARTMEFSFDIESNILAVPAGTQIQTLISNKKVAGFTYIAKYGFLGANGLNKPIVFDGMNTEGLYFGAFYFAGEASYAELTDENRSRAVSSEEMGNWVLGQFATVDEVTTALQDIEVVGTHIEEIDGFAPFHYAVTDASGKSVVIEYSADGLAIFENTVNAITNNPSYDWHLTNLRNYIGLAAKNRAAISVGAETLAPMGQGTGMFGLPGDMTSPSRFVRAAAFANSALAAADSEEAVFQAFHLLNAFDIPKGAIRESQDDQVHTDYTLWTSAADTSTGVYYYKTYISQGVESINVRNVMSSISKPTTLRMESGFSVRDRTSEFGR